MNFFTRRNRSQDISIEISTSKWDKLSEPLERREQLRHHSRSQDLRKMVKRNQAEFCRVSDQDSSG